MIVKGLYTAIVTPFKNGEVDYPKLAALVELQLQGGVAGIVPVGTTGESPTLSIREHLKVIETVIAAAKGRCQVIAGTGANSTDEAIELTLEAKKMGADASLQVTPYYNKPPQEGLYRHFAKIADDTGLPAILYNVPGRSAIAISIETIARLSTNPLIVAVKEAGGDVDRVSQILDACEITVLSGDDSLTLPMLSVGAQGIISVASNLCPGRIKEMLDAFFAGDLPKARAAHYKLYRFFKDVFVETNPIPIKAAMAMRGLIEEEYRLPLCPISDKAREVLKKAMERSGV